MTISWPNALKPNSISHELRSFSLSGGRSIAGTEQRVFSGLGRWEIKYDIHINSRDKVLAFRALIDRLRSGESVILKVFDMQMADGALGAEPSATVVSSSPSGSTSIQIEASGIEIEPGIHFSIGQRLYRINQVTAETASDSLVDIVLSDDKTWADAALWVEGGTGGSTYTVKFLPPLRAAASAGAEVDFTNLVCLCVPAELTDGDLSLDLGKFATASITFREA